MAQERLVVVKRQCKDQVWHEAISLQQYKWEQTHALQKTTEGETNISRESQFYPSEVI